MRVMIGAVALVLVTATAGPLQAQVQPPQDRINTALARARQVGIPVALLESKIAEGKAKGVSMERIAAAVERREAALERASQALRGRPEVDAADLSVAADALDSGVSEAVLRAIAETTPRERRAVAIAALTQLVELGHVPEAALERVRGALKRGPDALANLPAEAGAAPGRGNGPPDTPGSTGERGRGSAGPPASVPAPGGSSQPTKPGGGPPSTPGGNQTGRGTGRGGA
ncbi:MAG TPA: hypothetical protein VIK60_04930 [Vicinamibacterales bacterium]